MADQDGQYKTLPTIVASMVGEAKKKTLVLTLVFHPEPARIGETAQIERLSEGGAQILGRQFPLFSSAGENARPIGGRYISRAALQFRYCKGTLLVSRDSSSSRAQINGRELNGEVQLGDAELETGVPIMLGGNVVLLMRWVEGLGSVASRPLVSTQMRGSSDYMQGLRAQLARFARSDLDLLVRGETGTGKELVARAVHVASRRSGAKMIAVNMAAIPVSLAPSALFGSAKGAFSGADKAAAGYFGQAEGGTLFLDEIGETPPEIQAQLLRVLQQREMQCVGGAIRKVDLRVISATDAPLDIQSCNFKAALRHRLGEAEIVLLPLREHPEDIGELLWAFLKENMTSLGRSELLPAEHSDAAQVARWAEMFHRFVLYRWPGNIRELENFSHQIALASEDCLIVPEVLVERLCSDSSGREDSVRSRAGQGRPSALISDQEFLEGYEKSRYEVARVSRLLGLSRQAVYRRVSETPGLCLASELSESSICEAMRNCENDITLAAMALKVSRTSLRARLRHVPAALAG